MKGSKGGEGNKGSEGGKGEQRLRLPKAVARGCPRLWPKAAQGCGPRLWYEAVALGYSPRLWPRLWTNAA